MDGFSAAGTIDQVDYLGASTHYVVQLDGEETGRNQTGGEETGGERLLVEEANLNGPGWRVGDRVYASAEAAAVTWVHGDLASGQTTTAAGHAAA